MANRREENKMKKGLLKQVISALLVMCIMVGFVPVSIFASAAETRSAVTIEADKGLFELLEELVPFVPNNKLKENPTPSTIKAMAGTYYLVNANVQADGKRYGVDPITMPQISGLAFQTGRLGAVPVEIVGSGADSYVTGMKPSQAMTFTLALHGVNNTNQGVNAGSANSAKTSTSCVYTVQLSNGYYLKFSDKGTDTNGDEYDNGFSIRHASYEDPNYATIRIFSNQANGDATPQSQVLTRLVADNDYTNSSFGINGIGATPYFTLQSHATDAYKALNFIKFFELLDVVYTEELYNVINEAKAYIGTQAHMERIYEECLTRLYHAVLTYNRYNGAALTDEAQAEVDICAQELAYYLQLLESNPTRLLDLVNTMPEPIANNVWMDMRAHAIARQPVPDGKYYIAYDVAYNDYTVSNARILNPTIPDLYLQMSMSVGKAGTYPGGVLTGADPEWAIKFTKVEDYGYSSVANTAGFTNIQVFTGYTMQMEDGYYLGIDGETIASTTNYGIVRSATEKIVRHHISNYYNMSNLYDPGWSRRIAINEALDTATTATSGTAARLHLFKILEDRVYTEGLYNTIKAAKSYLTYKSYYDRSTHDDFWIDVEESIYLYNKVNGGSFSAEEKAAYQAQVDAAERKLINTMYIFNINAQGNSVTYVNATMHNWDPEGFNQLITDSLGDLSDVEEPIRAFFMGYQWGLPEDQSKIDPRSIGWNDTTTAMIPMSETTTASVNYGQFSIISGRAAENLKQTTNPPFDTANGIITLEDMWGTTQIPGIKDVYSNVKVPFVYNPTTGYYELNSDSNAVYFEGAPTDNTTLAIADKPALFYGQTYIASGRRTSSSVVHNKLWTHGLYDGYLTMFAPFSPITTQQWKGYDPSVWTGYSEPKREGYLIDGMGATVSSSTGTTYRPYDRGFVDFYFGMQLDVDFKISEDGLVNGEPITFEFAGDDDVYVYIDNKLVLDIGGTHDAINGTIDFSTGEVTVSSEKYGITYDRNHETGYSNDAAVEKYDLDVYPYTPGNSAKPDLAPKSNLIKGALKQKNIYTEVFNQTVEEFANDGQVHRLKIYYMESGAGISNCMIRFNMPQYDTLEVTKELSSIYANTGETMDEDLSHMSYDFVLVKNGHAMPNEAYYVVDGDSQSENRMTDAQGIFTIKEGQKAVFYALDYEASDVYQVVEYNLSDRWANNSWSYASATGGRELTVTSATAIYASPLFCIDGDSNKVESMQLVCTNSYKDESSSISADPVSLVIDYGKPVEVNVLENTTFRGVVDSVAETAKIVNILANDTTYGTSQLLDADDDGKNDSLRYTLTKFLDKNIVLTCQTQLTMLDRTTLIMEVPVIITPATTVYYETEKFDEVITTDVKLPTSIFVDFTENDVTVSGKTHMSVMNLDKEKGILSGTTSGYDPCVFLQKGNSMNYVIQKGDVLKVRLKAVSTNNTTQTNSAVYLATTKYPNLKYYVLSTIKSNSEYQELVMAIPEECVGQTLTKLRLDPTDQRNWNFEYDWVYVGPEIDPNMNWGMKNSYLTDIHDSYATNDYSAIEEGAEFFFDFSNTARDRERYLSNSYYGGFNYDVGNWVSHYTTGTTTSEHSNYGEDFTIDNDKGTLTLMVGYGYSEPDPNDSYKEMYGPEIYTTAVTGKYHMANPVLDYTPPADGVQRYVQVRFKTTNCMFDPYNSAQKKPVMILRYGVESTTPNEYGYYMTDYNPTGSRVQFDLHNDEYITLTAPLTEEFAGHILYLGVRFRNIIPAVGDEGSVEIDYIYIGTEDGLPSLNELQEHEVLGFDPDEAELTSALYFGFDNSEEAQERYLTNDSYRKTNFDDAENGHWVTRYVKEGDKNYSADYTIDNTTGVLMMVVEKGYSGSMSDSSLFYGPEIYTTSTSGSIDRNASYLEYVPADAEYMYVRFRTRNCAYDKGANTETAPNLILRYTYWDSAQNKYVEGYEYFSFELQNDQYITAKIKLRNAFKKAPELAYIGLRFRNVIQATDAGGFIDIDYIYIGPERTLPDDVLFFDFKDRKEDRERYSYSHYGNYNFDSKDDLHWYFDPNTATGIELDNSEGTLTVNARQSYSSGIYPCANFTTSTDTTFSRPLSYDAKKAEYYEIRFKLENFTSTSPAYASVHIWLNDLADSVSSEHFDLNKTHLTANKWVTVSIPLSEEIRSGGTITSVRPYFGQLKSISASQLGKLTVDYVYIGPEKTLPSRNGDVFGYDPSYVDDESFSNSQSLFVKGAGVANTAYILDGNGNKITGTDGKPLTEINYASAATYTEATFTFTGTGFDLISRTGKEQGALRVFICDQDGIIRKTVSVLNKGETELYQIPVVSAHDLAYGTYTAHVFVNAAYKYEGADNIFGDLLNRGDEFYFDAIRIYNPIDPSARDTDSTFARSAYQRDCEADPVYTEVRQLLIDANSFVADQTANGVLYLDAKPKADGNYGNIGEGLKPEVAVYAAIGPNNEVYLDSGNAIAFKLEAEGAIPASIDIGVKKVNAAVSMTTKIGSQAAYTNSIDSATSQYYPLSIDPSQWKTENGKNYVTVMITNSGASGILSITDVKYAYAVPKATSGTGYSLRFLVDKDLLLPAVETPTEDENLTFGAQLYLENDLTLAFRVKPDKLSAYDITTAYLVVEREVYETGAKDATLLTTTISDYTISDDGRVVFSYPGIAAAQMNDTIRATLYVKDANGKEYVSPVVNTSVATYLDGLLGTYANDAEMVTLIMDMLNYGAAAQIYFDRHADALVNEAFESFKTYASYASADFSTALEDLSATENAEGKSGKLSLGLDLGTRIGIQYKVTLPADVAAEDVSLVIADADGNTLETLTLTGEDVTMDNKGRYIVNFYGFTSKDMRRVVYATAYAGGEAITSTYVYSISTYAWGVQENASTMDAKLVAVTRMMMLYGDSAKAYFG